MTTAITGHRAWTARRFRRSTGTGPGAAATWTAAAHLLLDAAVGAVTAVAVGLGLLASLLLMPLALLGLPVWVATAALSAALARAECVRIRLLLGERIEPRPLPALGRGPGRDAGVLLRDPGVRRRLVHHLLAAPLGLVTTFVVYTLLTTAVLFLALPVLGLFLPTSTAELFDVPIASTGVRLLLGLAGVVLLVVVPTVVHGLAELDVRVARALLGPGPETLTDQVGHLERSRARVVDAAQAERRRIERDLHDGAQQQLVALAMTLGRARTRYRSEPGSVGPLLDDAHAQAKDALTALREVVRGLAPPVLADRGLDAALPALTARCPVPVRLTIGLDSRPPPPVEAAGYFVVAEALTNVARHAVASAASVSVTGDRNTLWITVTDDGRGGADPTSGTGLRGLADRIAGVDGRFAIDSPPGGPTVLTVELPCS